MCPANVANHGSTIGPNVLIPSSTTTTILTIINPYSTTFCALPRSLNTHFYHAAPSCLDCLPRQPHGSYAVMRSLATQGGVPHGIPMAL